MAEKVEPFGNQRTSGPLDRHHTIRAARPDWLWMKGRMKPGMQPAQVRAEFDGLVRRLGRGVSARRCARKRISVVPTRDVRINPDFDKTLAPAGLAARRRRRAGAHRRVRESREPHARARRRTTTRDRGARRARRRADSAHAPAVHGERSCSRCSVARSRCRSRLVSRALIARVQPPLPIDLGSRGESRLARARVHARRRDRHRRRVRAHSRAARVAARSRAALKDAQRKRQATSRRAARRARRGAGCGVARARRRRRAARAQPVGRGAA